MKRLLFTTGLFFIIIFFGFRVSPVSADCNIVGLDQNTRNLKVCVGEFATVEDLRKTTATIKCVNNSNLIVGGVCSGIVEPPPYSLSGHTDDVIAVDSNGKFYTCLIYENLNRAIGIVNVSFTGGTTCTTANYLTKPNDWDFLTEGLPWQQGTLNPIKSGAIFCPAGNNYINTSLGCINVGSPEGFIGSILKLAIGLGGGLALALILYGVFIVTTSGGIPDKLKAGGEIITSAVVGLIFIILSIFLVNLIGINILGIPGLS